MYVVAQCNTQEDPRYRILKIELASNHSYEGTLEDYLFDDEREYDKQSLTRLLSTINQGNKAYNQF